MTIMQALSDRWAVLAIFMINVGIFCFFLGRAVNAYYRLRAFDRHDRNNDFK